LVNVTSRRAIETSGLNSNGILAQSVGGYAAGGGGAGGLFAFGGSGASSGDGNTVSITNVGNVTTSAAGLTRSSPRASAAARQCGQLRGFVVLGGSGAAGGHGGQVTISNSAGITTHGDSATGITAQSIGGGGGLARGPADTSASGRWRQQRQWRRCHR